MRVYEVMSGNPLSESPEMIGSTDFGLSDNTKRYQFIRHLMNIRPNEKIEETDAYELFRAGNEPLVHFYMLEKKYGDLVYFIKCEIADISFIGKSVSQVALWRDWYYPISSGVSTKIFFEYLLKEWPVVISDEQQTEAGKAFWVRHMNIAYDRGLKVGLTDLRSKSVSWAEEPFRDWLSHNEKAWTNDPSGQYLRFVISVD